MEVQPLFLGGTLPNADILPALTVTEIPQAGFELLFETRLGMELSVLGARDKLVECLQVCLSRKPYSPHE